MHTDNKSTNTPCVYTIQTNAVLFYIMILYEQIATHYVFIKKSHFSVTKGTNCKDIHVGVHFFVCLAECKCSGVLDWILLPGDPENVTIGLCTYLPLVVNQCQTLICLLDGFQRGLRLFSVWSENAALFKRKFIQIQQY